MPKNTIIPYRKDLKLLAKKLRNNSTLSEELLWCEIKNKQLEGYQFHRQVPMLDYIVDFYCDELKLVIVIGGDSYYHDNAHIKDAFRQNRIETYGIEFLRFDDQDVKQKMSHVIASIIDWIMEQKARS